MENTIYHLYLNTFDNTTIIVTDNIQEMFVTGLTRRGSEPKLLYSSSNIDEIQTKALIFDSALFSTVNSN